MVAIKSFSDSERMLPGREFHSSIVRGKKLHVLVRAKIVVILRAWELRVQLAFVNVM